MTIKKFTISMNRKVCYEAGWNDALKKVEELIDELGENIIGLFDVYEIKVVNDGNELTLREHEKNRMIKEEANKIKQKLRGGE